MGKIKEIGKRAYNLKNPCEQRRYVVFLLRSLLHRSELKDLLRFFESKPVLAKMLAINPFPVEQVTRAFFYNKSTFSERIALVKNHCELMSSILTEDCFLSISNATYHPYTVWKSTYEDKIWQAQLGFEAGQRKEGMLSLELNLGNVHIYQLMFWAGYDAEGHKSIYIGAMQGPNMENARDVIKKMTKACHGYRTKNLILYMLQAVARAMGIEKLYAVSNYGYYANNHVRLDRKLKTNFGDFWQEAGGKETSDNRWFELPLVEARKTMEEVPTRKRAVYRRRFAFLDEVDAEIEKNIKTVLK